MYFKCIMKKVFYHLVFRPRVACIMSFLIFSLWGLQALAQIFPYSPYTQPYFQLFPNPYTVNYTPNTVFNRIGAYNGINPFIGVYNSFSVLNALSALNGTSLYPQANIAGGLVPFSSFYANPFLLPYNAAGAYFAAAVIPADVAGSWSGVWTSTFLAGGVITGDLSLTLAQVESDVTGTVAFFLNKILKFGADVVGSVSGNELTLTSTVIPGAGGTKTFDVTIAATVSGSSMDGTYLVINNVTGNIAEEGTFYANRL